jgi:sucrose-6-phosphate hydrolase SacC (GH32 family)
LKNQVHEFASEEGQFVDHGNVWECPDFYSLGNSYLFKYSSIATRSDIWNIGVYDPEAMTFTPGIRVFSLFS